MPEASHNDIAVALLKRTEEASKGSACLDILGGIYTEG